jgi:hypothetical protein
MCPKARPIAPPEDDVAADGPWSPGRQQASAFCRIVLRGAVRRRHALGLPTQNAERRLNLPALLDDCLHEISNPLTVSVAGQPRSGAPNANPIRQLKGYRQSTVRAAVLSSAMPRRRDLGVARRMVTCRRRARRR